LTAFDLTTIVLRNAPISEVLYLTVILPVFPGITGFASNDGVVQPHEDITELIIRGSSPVLVNWKQTFFSRLLLLYHNQ